VTNKEALQSLTEYDNDNLIEKLLLDRGINAGAIYTASGVRNIDLCAADLYGVLAGHPELKEGSRFVKFNPPQLYRMKRDILRKYGLEEAGIDGTNVW